MTGTSSKKFRAPGDPKDERETIGADYTPPPGTRGPKYGKSGYYSQPKLSAGDTKLLARLVNIYGRKAITTASAEVQTRGPGQPRRGDPPRHQLIHFAVRHIRLLARLVRKYGRALVAAAAGKVPPPRKVGWPARALAAYLERKHEAAWIEDVVEEHRRDGSRQPYLDAEIDLYDLLHSKEAQLTLSKEDKRALDKFLNTMKRKRYRGRRELQEARKFAVLRERYLESLRTK
jgi:hypothetical protein